MSGFLSIFSTYAQRPAKRSEVRDFERASSLVFSKDYRTLPNCDVAFVELRFALSQSLAVMGILS